MINSESRIVMNGSVLYLLPTSSNSSILNKAIPKTRSLSDIEMVLQTPSEDLHVDRRNSVSGPVPMDTTLSSNASAVEALVGPFKTLQEAQVAASLLKHKNANSGMPVSVNLPQNINGRPSVFMSTRSSTDFTDNLKVSTALSPQVIFPNKSKELTWTKPLSTKGHGNHQTCSAIPDASKMQAISCTSVTSSPQVIFSNESKQFTWTKPLPTKGHENHQLCSAIPEASKMQAISCTSVTSSPQVSSVDNSKIWAKPQSFLPSRIEGIADVGSCQEDSVTSPKVCKTEADNPPVKKKTPIRKKKSAPSITKAVSLVFFDLETTGLAFQIGKSNVQITEVSMIAMNRKEFEQSTFEDLRDVRIIQKLCLCTRPRTEVSSGAAAVTGLNNENLIDQNPFERSAAEAISCFLSHLPKPVCLLAHNGNNYDFPLLKAEFSRLAMSLPPDILIADTLKAFRALGVPVFPPEKKICKSVKFTKKGQVSYSLSNLHLYFFNRNPTGSHSSEGDCIALAKVCHRMKDLMLLWFDENCTTFDSVSPMW